MQKTDIDLDLVSSVIEMVCKEDGRVVSWEWGTKAHQIKTEAQKSLKEMEGEKRKSWVEISGVEETLLPYFLELSMIEEPSREKRSCHSCQSQSRIIGRQAVPR